MYLIPYKKCIGFRLISAENVQLTKRMNMKKERECAREDERSRKRARCRKRALLIIISSLKNTQLLERACEQINTH